jgi:hypothetical protein
MTSAAANRRIAGRLVRNLVVTLAVTAIFGLKAAEERARTPDAWAMTLASR